MSITERLLEYAEHRRNCLVSYWEGGEPTPDGGYGSKFKGEWYQSRPVDESPKCTCGLDEIWAEIMAEKAAKTEGQNEQ